MLENVVRESVLRAYAWATKLGVHRLPIFDRMFLSLYDVYKRHFEAGPIERLREFVPAGSMVLDVGANVGFFTLRFARWVDIGEVIAIEPEEKNYRALEAALERNGLQRNVRVLKAVATATAGTAHIDINPIHPADHKLSVDGTGVRVDAVRLDDLVDRNGLLRPSLIKIDVQGAEMLVLQGAADILRLYRPALFVELSEDGLRRFGSSVSEVIRHLSRCDYESYWLMRAGPHQRASEEDIQASVRRHGYVDVLFLSSSETDIAD
jgi:FkbM family methyltransferase